MKKEKKEIFIPDKDSYKPYSLGITRYRKCPVCKGYREYPDCFWSEGLCDYCADYIFTESELFKRYLRAIKKGYIQHVLDGHAYFFSKN